MPKSTNNPVARRNRIGCFAILAVLALFLALYLFAGFSAEPGNAMSEDIQAVPAR